MFEITRSDGRSNAQVLLDYVKDGEPGRLYPYDELISVLSAGSARMFTKTTVRGVVISAHPRFLKTYDRALQNVRGQGYRLALAQEQKGMALQRKRRSDVQLIRGMELLQHVRLDDMDPMARAAHEGTMMILGALWQNQQAQDRRLRKVEETIRKMAK